MPTLIRVSRRKPAATLEALQKDSAVWEITKEVQGVWQEIPYHTVTPQNIADALAKTHAKVEMTTEDADYRPYWNEDEQTWCIRCQTTTFIELGDTDANNPVEVRCVVELKYC